MKTLNEIGKELDNKTRFSWDVDTNRVYTRECEVGEDYDLTIEDGEYVLTMTGSTQRFNSLADVIDFINA